MAIIKVLIVFKYFRLPASSLLSFFLIANYLFMENCKLLFVATCYVGKKPNY